MWVHLPAAGISGDRWASSTRQLAPATLRGHGDMVKAWTNAKVNGSIIPTRDYTGGFSGRTLKAGTTVIIVDVHKGVFGNPIALSVRDPKSGKYFRRVPMEVFAR
jgi:hypothetical protein